MESLAIQGQILTASSGEEYDKAIHHIPPILKYAKSQSPPFEIAVKGGGAHSSTWASSLGGLVIDLAKLNAVSVSTDRKSVVVQGGALWGDVYDACKKANVDVVGGPLWFVGVGGFMLGGGYSPLSGEHGLATDNLLAATVVLANGRIVKASATEESDLYWAIRGGGSQFGIVVEFVLKAYPQHGPFTAGVLAYPGTEINNVLQVVNEWKTSQTGRERLSLTFSRPAPYYKPTVLILPLVFNGRDPVTVLSPFRDGAIKPVFDKVATVPDMLTVSHAADAQLASAPRRLTIRGALFSEYWTDMVVEVWNRWCKFTDENEDHRSSVIVWDLTKPDGIAERDTSDTAVNVRDPHHWVTIQGRSSTAAGDEASRNFVASTANYIRVTNAHKSGKDLGVFISFAQGDEKVEDVFGGNLPRLRDLKVKYDPEKVWSKGLAI